MGAVRDQASRDETTLQIGTAVFVFAVIVGAFVGLGAVFDLSESVPGWLGVVLIGLAALVAGRGLVHRDRMRHR